MIKFKNSKGETVFEIKDEDSRPKRLKITRDGDTTIIEEENEDEQLHGDGPVKDSAGKESN